MHVWEDKYKREGLIGTIVFHVILLLIFIFAGLPYTIPRPEQGILVNFGTSDVGSGEVQPDVSGATSTQQPVDPTPEPVTQPEPNNTPPVEEQVVTQDNEEAPEVPASEEPKEETKPSEKKPTETTPKEEPKPVEEPKISNKLSDALSKLKTSSQNAGGSEGDDDQAGDKGQINGDKNGEAYTGAGSGNGDYQLGNRKALSRPKPSYTCQEEGKVVIDIKVDRTGKTVNATVGKGTTNTAECLTSQAIQAALKTKWQSNPDAPFEQVGKITYHFILK